MKLILTQSTLSSLSSAGHRFEIRERSPVRETTSIGLSRTDNEAVLPAKEGEHSLALSLSLSVSLAHPPALSLPLSPPPATRAFSVRRSGARALTNDEAVVVERVAGVSSI